MEFRSSSPVCFEKEQGYEELIFAEDDITCYDSQNGFHLTFLTGYKHVNEMPFAIHLSYGNSFETSYMSDDT